MSNSPEDPLEYDQEVYSDAEYSDEAENQRPSWKRPESGRSPAYERLLDLSYFLREQFFIWNKRILILMAVTTGLAVIAELQGGYISKALEAVSKYAKDSKEAHDNISTLKRITLVRARLLKYERKLAVLKNEEEVKKLIIEQPDKYPEEWIDAFDDIKKEMQTGINLAKKLQKSRIRFSPEFMNDSIDQIDRVYKDLKEGERLLKLKIDNFGLKEHYFAPEIVEAIENLYKALAECKIRVYLFRKELKALRDEDVEGNSSNVVVDEYIKNKDHPTVKRLMEHMEKRRIEERKKNMDKRGLKKKQRLRQR